MKIDSQENGKPGNGILISRFPVFLLITLIFAVCLCSTPVVADAQNNVESVFLPTGTEGAYTLKVTATNINSDGVPNNASAMPTLPTSKGSGPSWQRSGGKSGPPKPSPSGSPNCTTKPGTTR